MEGEPSQRTSKPRPADRAPVNDSEATMNSSQAPTPQRVLPLRDARRKKLKTTDIDKDGFEKPHQKHTAKHQVAMDTTPIDLENLYASLSETETEPEREVDTQSPKRKRLLYRKQNTEQPPSSSLKPPQNEKSVMPIRIPTTSFEEIKTVLAPLNLKTPPDVIKGAGTSFQVIPKSLADKVKVIEAMKVKNIANYTHCETDDRRKIFVLKGHHHVDNQELLETLKAQNIPAKAVSQIGRSQENPIYTVSFEKSTISLDVLVHQHKVIKWKEEGVNLRVKWEKFKPSTKRYIQCSNCQLWGHGKMHCHMPRRCVKCLDTHALGECSRKERTDQGEPACVNCGKSGHPANSTTCEVYKKHVENNLNPPPLHGHLKSMTVTNFLSFREI